MADPPAVEGMVEVEVEEQVAAHAVAVVMVLAAEVWVMEVAEMLEGEMVEHSSVARPGMRPGRSR